MPVIDPGANGVGNPGHSWLLYKLLMAKPAARSPWAFTVMAWQPISDAERSVLASFVNGREIPFPSMPSQTLSPGP